MTDAWGRDLDTSCQLGIETVLLRILYSLINMNCQCCLLYFEDASENTYQVVERIPCHDGQEARRLCQAARHAGTNLYVDFDVIHASVEPCTGVAETQIQQS